jgi:diaminohydroxyphosphoribosylaminopyrimidine deaminase/5-amino-6-(5-phosphoribosylamino)uracil reductase
VGEQLALRDLADEVIVSTSPAVLGREGITAVRPALAALLAEGRRFALARQEMIGHDSFTFYERND